MKNGQKLQLIIDDKVIDCDESSSMTFERIVKVFKFHARKLVNFQELYDQVNRISPRYFNPSFPIDCDISRDGDDLVKDQLTIRMTQNKF